MKKWLKSILAVCLLAGCQRKNEEVPEVMQENRTIVRLQYEISVAMVKGEDVSIAVNPNEIEWIACMDEDTYI